MTETATPPSSSEKLFLTVMSLIAFLVGATGSLYSLAAAWFLSRDLIMETHLHAGLLMDLYLLVGLSFLVIGLSVGFVCRCQRPSPFIAGSIGFSLLPLLLMQPLLEVFALLTVWSGGLLGLGIGIFLKDFLTRKTNAAKR